MVKRSANCPDNEPEQATFDLPSEKEHLFTVSNLYTSDENPFHSGLPNDIVVVKSEVTGGNEEGRTVLTRLTLDDQAKGFFATRLFLKAIGEPHKGNIEIDTDKWQARQYFATVVHNGKYANIDEYNFEKKVDNVVPKSLNPSSVKDPKDIAWEE